MTSDGAILYFLRMYADKSPQSLVRGVGKWDPPISVETLLRKKIKCLFITSYKLFLFIVPVTQLLEKLCWPLVWMCSFMPSLTAMSLTATSLCSTIIVKLFHRMRHLLSPCKVFQSIFSAHQLSLGLKGNLRHPGHIYCSHKRIW